MRVTTTDPMTGNEVTETENAPSRVEGEGDGALKICFASEASRQANLDFSAESDITDTGVVDAYNQLGDNETTGTIDQGHTLVSPSNRCTPIYAAIRTSV